MSTKYVDIPSTIQVIGCVYNNPHLLFMLKDGKMY